MEKYFGISTETIYKMRHDLAQSLATSILENTNFPKDECIYKRIKRQSLMITELTEELLFRNDEIIERISQE